jgi:hypothetical protein
LFWQFIVLQADLYRSQLPLGLMARQLDRIGEEKKAALAKRGTVSSQNFA